MLSAPRLSPDGTQFAVIKPVDGRNAVVVYSVTDKNMKPKMFQDTTWNILNVRWASNDRFLVTVKTQAPFIGDLRTWYRTISLSTKGGEPLALFQDSNSSPFNLGTFVTAIDLDDPNHVFMPFQTLPGHMRDDLYRVDVNSGQRELAEKDYGSTYQWIADGHGHVLGRIGYDAVGQRQRVFAKTETWNEVAEITLGTDGVIENLGITPDDKGFVFLQADRSDMRGLMRLDLAPGATVSEFYFDPSFDVAGTIRDEWSGEVLGAVVVTDKPEDRYFNAHRKALQASLEKASPGLVVHIVSVDKAADEAIVMTEGPKNPPTYYIVNLADGAVYRIASAYPGLSPGDLGEMKPYPYTARDGLKIPAYLTLPPDRSARELPTIVMPHGGPDARDAIGFDWWAQFLANRGYAVLQPNYRGSSGYGRAFTKAGALQWGLKMQDDISDGVKQMIADGIADPKRICIVGASYGGYAALAGATLSPDLYACAVSVAGISDLRTLLSWEVPWGHAFDENFLRSRLGLRYADEKRLEQTSPLLHVDQVRCPILLMHGKNDTTVPVEQSQDMRKALTRAGKTVKYVQFDSDDHYFTLAATRIQMLTELERFLSANIGR
jgi:dipeptidyl aminopeptidase/acylaminoacyl peptidase